MGALAELAEANAAPSAFDKLRQRGALASASSANAPPSAFDKLSRRERWLSLPKPTPTHRLRQAPPTGALAQSARTLAELAEANTDPSAATGSADGRVTEVRDEKFKQKNRWHLASVLDERAGVHYIAHEGEAPEWNEWVSSRRIRPLI